MINPSARRAIVEALGAEPGSAVWEIGGGLGCMTAELLGRGLRVTAFEIDPGFCAVLEELFGADPAFTLVPGDALETWETAAAPPAAAPAVAVTAAGIEASAAGLRLLGNLPYTVAAPLVGKLIERRRFFSRMVVTVQKEVALRMAASPGSPDYSSLSVLCSSAYDMKIIMTLKGPSFYPVPHVDSAVVRFDLKEPLSPPPLFYPLLRALFAARRKTAANNLEHFLAASGTMNKRLAAVSALERSGIPPGSRAETLPPEAFMRLAVELEGLWKPPRGERV